MEKKPRKSSKKWIWFVGIAVVLVGAAVAFVLPGLQTASSAATTSYKTQAAARGSLSTTVGANGNVYTRQTVNLTWPVKRDRQPGQRDQGPKGGERHGAGRAGSGQPAAERLECRHRPGHRSAGLDDLLNSNTARANAELALIEHRAGPASTPRKPPSPSSTSAPARQ